MNFEETIEESLDGLWGNRQYGGNSELPRKDYQPYSTSNGYTFPYQSGSPPATPPIPQDPDNTVSVPWPLNNVTNDLADSFVYLLSAYRCMQRCIKENPALNKKQKMAIKILLKFTKGALMRIKKVGETILTVANLADKLPPQSPDIF